MRFNYWKVYINENVQQILKIVQEHIYEQWDADPNDPLDWNFWIYDISALTDIGVTRSLTDRPQIFNFFVESRYAKAVASIKYIHPALFNYKAEKKIRLRIPLIPEKLRASIEPDTPSILQRLEDIPRLLNAWFEIDLSFAPIVLHSEYLNDRKKLFQTVDAILSSSEKAECKYDAHFLSHHKWQHKRNLKNWFKKAEKILRKWLDHTSKRKRIRTYPKQKKISFLKDFIDLHDQYIPWNKSRVYTI